MFVSRSRRGGGDRSLDARMALFAAGAALGVVGIVRDGDGWWVFSGIAFLAAGMVLSMMESVRRRRAAGAEDDGGAEEPGGGDPREPNA